MTLPTNVSYGQIVHRMVLAVGDGADVDRTPDVVPVAGAQITFTPSVAWLLNVSASPDPVTIYPQRVVCSTDSEGYLIDPMGVRGVWLVATDDPDLNPSGFTYSVDVRATGLSTRTFSISVPGGVITDLTSVTPVSAASGNPTVVGPPGPQGTPGTPGAPGTAGPPNALTVGTVTTGAAGSAAAASITGTSPAQVLGLTIPQGAAGAAGSPTAYELRGAGIPEGTVTAPVGTYYTDTAATRGAIRWVKATGAGNTGWQVLYGDTGWRLLSSWAADGVVTGTALPSGWTVQSGQAGLIEVRRTADAVYWRMTGLTSNGASVYVSPTGFGPGTTHYVAVPIATSAGTFVRATIAAAGVYLSGTVQTGGFGSAFNYQSDAAWPTTLPGTAA